MGKLHEECGVFGIYGGENTNVVSATYYALYALQHRGQESAGIAVNKDGVIYSYKDTGLVNEVFTNETLGKLQNGQMAIGHVRYTTRDGKHRSNAQPMVLNHIKGSLAIAHNGSVTNAYELREQMELGGAIFHTNSDTEVIAYAITKARLHKSSIEDAILEAMKTIKGAFSDVVMSPQKLIGVRDPYGFRPLCIGRLDNGGWVIASETCALDSVNATFVRDVEPGEVVVIDKNGLRSLKSDIQVDKKGLCVFEFIYFARPDSVVDGTSVHEARKRAGAYLAKAHPVDADVVIGVPDSGLDAAVGYAEESGIPYGMGFLKNKYIGRTFIQPTQEERENLVRIKLNAIKKTVCGKRVVMIDDSIVRGTTCARIVRILREAGAKEVHMRVSSPPFLFPCYFGTDIDSKDKLIANNHTVEEIRQIIGVDSLGYLPKENVVQLAKETHLDFCTGCFTGEYPAETPEEFNKQSKYTKPIEKGGN